MGASPRFLLAGGWQRRADRGPGRSRTAGGERGAGTRDDRRRRRAGARALGLELYDVESPARGAPAPFVSSSTATAASTSTRSRRRRKRDLARARRRRPIDGPYLARGEQPRARASAAPARALPPARSARPCQIKVHTPTARPERRARRARRRRRATASPATSRSTASASSIAYDAITKARTVFEWGPAPQRAKPTKKNARAAKESA